MTDLDLLALSIIGLVGLLEVLVIRYAWRRE